MTFSRVAKNIVPSRFIENQQLNKIAIGALKIDF